MRYLRCALLLWCCECANVQFSRKRLYAEEGGSATYEISLEQAPTANVEIRFARSDAALVGTSTRSDTSWSFLFDDTHQYLRFTAADWAAKTVRLTATSNTVDSGKYYTDVYVTHSVTSTDNNYNALLGFDPSQVVTLRIYDDDSCLRDCAPGTYFDLCNSTQSCLPCPPGQYCPGACSSPVACAAGTSVADFGSNSTAACTNCTVGKYALMLGSSVCETCPAGYSCDGKAAAPVGCEKGHYSSAGSGSCDACSSGYYASSSFSSSCLKCPTGHACFDANTDPLPCSAASYALGAATACSSCPAGYACSSTASAPIPCELGASYALDNWAFCLVCPAGYACNSTTTPPRACPLGSAALSGRGECEACGNGTYANRTASSRCEICPRGHSCEDPSANPAPCAAGNYSGIGATECSFCPLGSYSLFPRSTFSSCEMCPAGFYCPQRNADPLSCPSGSVNVQGYNTGCTLCKPGTTTSADGMNCVQCPAGFECPTSEEAVRCGNGTYSLGGNITSCPACPSGYSCPSVSSPPRLCPRGYTSAKGVLDCEECARGSECAVQDLEPTKCIAGWYSPLNGSSFCKPCPAGYECPNATMLPVPCTVGSYSFEADLECRDCPKGYACPRADIFAPTPCALGQYSPGNSTQCFDCEPGYFCNTTDIFAPTKCPYGTYSAALSTECKFCPLGFRLTNASSSSSGSCTACPRGSYCPFPEQPEIVVGCSPGTYSLGAQHLCTACPPGEYCPHTTMPTRIPCPAGTFSSGAQAACTECPAGFECARTDSAFISTCPPGMTSSLGEPYCRRCPAGTYCPHPAAQPLPCQRGTFSFIGSTNCTACERGHSCFDPALPPAKCAVGYFSAGSSTYCSQCAPGFRCPEASVTAAPAGSACPIGTYCNPASQSVNCPPGTYGNATAATSEAEACVLCDAGFYCQKLSTLTTTMVECPAGYYCPRGSYDPEPCPAGSYSDERGLTSQTCLTCVPGRYCHEASTSGSATTCEVGYYCPAGTSSWDEYPCPAGTYSSTGGLHDASQCRSCTRGSYCPAGVSTPRACPVATYNTQPGSRHLTDCRACEPGWACPVPGEAYVWEKCKPGHYCPAGTSYPEQFPCPAGTYSDGDDLVTVEDCTVCPAGFSCVEGTTSATISVCAAGYYCLAGSFTTTPATICPPGTYSNKTTLATLAECAECPPGYVCLGSQQAVSATCTAGYYCPAGSASGTNNPCAAGTYSDRTDLYSAEQCDQCTPGYYCASGVSVMTQCNAGRFTPNNASTANAGTVCASYPSDCVTDATTCVRCLAGYYCEQGATEPLPCGVGLYSTPADSVCLVCDAGYYCGSNTTVQTDMLANGGSWISADKEGQCFPGAYCPAGMSRQPTMLLDACPVGHYCPVATPLPVECPAGTYNAFPGAEAVEGCATTPAGFYSVPGATNVTGLCSPGYYCPAGSTGPQSMPCPAAYYNPLYGRTIAEECALCVSGGYCVLGSAKPTSCPRGYYCVAGLDAPAPCPVGTYGNSSGLRRAEDCTACDPGYFCDGLGLPRPRGPCDPGYYCVSGSYTSAPHAPGSPSTVEPTSIGGRCPAGGYCPLGSSWQTACRAGTFSNSTGASTEDDCFDCPAGYYCTGSSNPYPSGPCRAGYYCESGSTTPTQYECQAGKSSDLGSARDCDECLPGKWQPYRAQASCEDCPVGYYCDQYGMTTFKPCPAGYYCPLGTAEYERYPCPFGMYGSQELLVSVDECSLCDAGEYCEGSALSQPTGKCEAGYYCSQGAFDQQGEYCIDLAIYKSDYDPDTDYNVTTDDAITESYLIDCGADGGGCTVGHYCKEGSSYPFPCELGTYFPSTLNQVGCTVCDPGYACDDSGLGAPTEECDAGFFCRNVVNGASSTQPLCFDGDAGCEDDFGLCPRGHECPQGTIEPEPCEKGTYAPVEGLAECHSCPAGSYCNASKTSFEDCPQGSYCPLGTGATPPLCPIGRYGHARRLTHSTECALCAEGYYCPTPGLTRASLQCGAGYYCPLGSKDQQGLTDVTHQCPSGAYCPFGSKTPHLCPAGKYSAGLGEESFSCLPCTAGYYCDSAGLSAPVAKCEAGYYCPPGVDTKRPLSTICPAGSACAEGVGSHTQCLSGTYAPRQGLGACLACPAGYGCAGLGTVNHEDLPCLPGYFCPEGSSSDVEVPCPAGYWSNLSLATSGLTCVAVPPGHYAVGVGNALPQGLCDPGYFCTGKATSRTPASDFGGPCAATANCPAGATEEAPCPGGRYCDGLGIVGSCSPGYYCTSGSTSHEPLSLPDADECPLGHYCPLASTTPTACPPGTFANTTRNTNLTDCHDCAAGFTCPNASTTNPAFACPIGYYCPKGSVLGYPCPAGTYCPPGSFRPTECAAGSYQPHTVSQNCILCPSGFFCREASAFYADCPPGHYCPNGTNAEFQFPCPNRTFSNFTRLQAREECSICLPGMYCGDDGLREPTGHCDSGFFCAEGSNVNRPPNTWSLL